MSNVLPFVALMSVPKARRRRLMPIALPAVAGMPVAQAGALAVVSADGAARHEATAAGAEATAAVTAVLRTAVDKGATLSPEDLAHIPLAGQVVAANPDILAARSLAGVSRAELQRAVALIQAALGQEDDGASDGKSDKKPDGRSDGAGKAADAPAGSGASGGSDGGGGRSGGKA